MTVAEVKFFRRYLGWALVLSLSPLTALVAAEQTAGGDDFRTVAMPLLEKYCYKCHDEKKGCEECHGRNRNDLFDHASTGWELQPYHKVLQCKECHATPGKYEANDPRCGTCHYDGRDEKHFNHGVTGVVLDEVHGDMDCTDCHVGGLGNKSDCSGCHDDGRKWTRHGSFGPGID